MGLPLGRSQLSRLHLAKTFASNCRSRKRGTICLCILSHPISLMGMSTTLPFGKTPRFVSPDKPDLLLRDLRRAEAYLAKNRERILASVTTCLNAAAEFMASHGKRIELSRFRNRRSDRPEDTGGLVSVLGNR